MNAYIEIITAALPVVQNDSAQERDKHLYVRYELTDSDLREIGQFTRGNVRTWMESHQGVDWFDILCWGPIHDFHAVCGDNSGRRDMDIPWAKEESKQLFQRVWRKEKQ